MDAHHGEFLECTKTVDNVDYQVYIFFDLEWQLRRACSAWWCSGVEWLAVSFIVKLVINV